MQPDVSQGKLAFAMLRQKYRFSMHETMYIGLNNEFIKSLFFTSAIIIIHIGIMLKLATMMYSVNHIRHFGPFEDPDCITRLQAIGAVANLFAFCLEQLKKVIFLLRNAFKQQLWLYDVSLIGMFRFRWRQ